MSFTLQDAEEMMAQTSEAVPGSYTDRDTLLYAVAIGMGRDPLDPKELPYVCETQGDKVVPTAASVLSRPDVPRAGGMMGSGPQSKLNYAMMLHGEQRLIVHKPLPAAAETMISNRTAGIYDKGEGRGMLMVNETTVSEKESGDKLFTSSSTGFYRADGGFGGSAEGAPVPHPIPERDPDATCETETRVDQALIYALCGDRNPLHRDPEIAKKGGFDVPILHGLCSYGVSCHAVLKTMCDYDNTAIAGYDVRFSTPVFPGETFVTEMWKDGNIVSFRVRLKERNVIAINNGKCTLR